MDSGHRHVTDMQGVRYALGRQIGRGGQGAVFEVEGDRLAVKLLIDASPSRRERLLNQLAHVKRLPLQDIDIARPRAVLRAPHLGYVMERLTGMIPLETLAHPPQGEPSVTRWYIAGGGLRRRLRLLAYAADVIAQLHGKGLVYGDPSPHNVFVSENTGDHEVRLIDADNIHYQSSPATPGIYTPGYGAPELILRKSGVNTLTDAHAFAVMAFRVLTLAHPFLGDGVVNGEPEREEEAFEGKVPYIEHPTDESNRSTLGIQRGIVLSGELVKLCERTFVDGLLAPTKRPGIAAWAERLFAAADATLTCPECGASYYFKAASCPFCECAKPRFVTAVFHLWDPSLGRAKEIVERPDKKPLIAAVAVLADQAPLVITGRLARASDGRASRIPHVEVRLVGRRLAVRSLDDATYLVTFASGDKSVEVGSNTVELDARTPFHLHFGNPDSLHRIVRFELRSGASA
ncbi:hypothetical protein WME99_05740 [Sorangium sp. So ce136]|uniref:protein kinase domain-containing protein n=1 Tax=Sorangium sp. So ce136 TaxID=3133284 RepID=UPI003F10C14E